MNGRSKFNKRVGILICCLLLFSSQVWSRSQYDVKAAYLYNFIKFVNWPDEDNKEVLNVCTYGEDPINTKLAPLNSVKIRTLKAKLSQIDSIPDITKCDVLYLSAEKEKHLPALNEAAINHPVLMVSDIADFAEKGGIIEFIALGNVIRFNINYAHARKKQLFISSKLLELANDIKQ